MNTWNSNFNTCEAPQEEDEEDEDSRTLHADTATAKVTQQTKLLQLTDSIKQKLTEYGNWKRRPLSVCEGGPEPTCTENKKLYTFKYKVHHQGGKSKWLNEPNREEIVELAGASFMIWRPYESEENAIARIIEYTFSRPLNEYPQIVPTVSQHSFSNPHTSAPTKIKKKKSRQSESEKDAIARIIAHTNSIPLSEYPQIVPTYLTQRANSDKHTKM